MYNSFVSVSEFLDHVSIVNESQKQCKYSTQEGWKPSSLTLPNYNYSKYTII